jgi:hypothetical protein
MGLRIGAAGSTADIPRPKAVERGGAMNGETGQ